VLTIVLTRHGHTDRSEPEQYLGQTIDVAISERGREQALALHDRLASVTFGRVLSSPLRRARQTAEIVRPDAIIEIDDRLKEADYGAWEGLTIDEIDAQWPRERAAWEADPTAVAPPAGERADEVAARAGQLLTDLRHWDAGLGAADRDHRVLVVGHSTLNRVLLAVALGIPLPDYRRRLRQDWVNLTVLRYVPDDRDGAQLLLANDLAHLRGVAGLTWN
jgi:probable phosphoglycerate mutase